MQTISPFALLCALKSYSALLICIMQNGSTISRNKQVLCEKGIVSMVLQKKHYGTVSNVSVGYFRILIVIWNTMKAPFLTMIDLE